jgi:hypothetical protein
MSPYVRPYVPHDPDDEAAAETVAVDETGEQLMECTECEWVGPTTEFVPENYR